MTLQLQALIFVFVGGCETHSNDPNREIAVITCYLDESGTEGTSPTAVVGGLLLKQKDLFYLDIEWLKILDRYNLQPPLHMSEFGKHGRFRDIPPDVCRALFADVTRTINRHKLATIAATVNTKQYNRAFDGLTGFSIYGACFIQLALVNGANAQVNQYFDPIPILMDEGNPYKHHALEAHSYLMMNRREKFNIGALRFDTDNNVCALQAADVVAWAIRRRLAGNFGYRFEPLQGIIEEPHIEQEYEESWMMETAETLRADEAARQKNGQKSGI